MATLREDRGAAAAEVAIGSVRTTEGSPALNFRSTAGGEEPPRVNVAIVTFERETCVLELVEDLLDQDYPSYDVTIVDQNPEPLESFQQAAKASGGKLRITHLRPPHVCVARNVSIRAADGEIMVFVDDDVRCGRDFVSAHVACYADPRVGGVGGWIDAPVPSRVWRPKAQSVPAAIGCNMSYRRAALIRAGGFDRNFKPFPAHGEEHELAYRVRRLGLQIAVAPRALVYHQIDPEGGQRPRNPLQYWKDTTSSHVLLFLKTRPWFHKMLMPLWLVKLWVTLYHLSTGTLGPLKFWRGVREGLVITRESRKSSEYLTSTPEPRWVRL